MNHSKQSQNMHKKSALFCCAAQQENDDFDYVVESCGRLATSRDSLFVGWIFDRSIGHCFGSSSNMNIALRERDFDAMFLEQVPHAF